jgi:sugar lactone lactonase YvrE
VLVGFLAFGVSCDCAFAQKVTFTGAQSTLGSGLRTPSGVAVDGAGNVYIADSANSRVVKVPAGGGTQTTVADGFNGPIGMAVDAAGDVFVADFENNRVVEIPADGGSELLVGVQLSGPTSVAIDVAGDIFIADSGNNRVVEIPAPSKHEGQTTVGTGLSQPEAVAVDAAGDVFIADLENNRVVKVPAGGGSQTTVGTGLSEPAGVAVDPAGNVFVVNHGGSTVVEVPAVGGPQIEIGSGWNDPEQIAVDNGGGIYVADGGNNRVVELQTKAVNFGGANVCPAGKTTPAPCGATVTLNYSYTSVDDVSSLALYTLGGPSTDFELAAGTTCGFTTSGNTCVVVLSFTPAQAGLRQGAFQFFDDHGNVNASTSLYGTGDGPQIAYTTTAQSTLGSGFSFPSGVAMDGAGNVYVADSLHGRVVVLPVGGGTPLDLGSGGLPVGVAVDGAGDLYISDYAGGDVVVAPRDGTPTTLSPGLKNPYQIALDGRGDLFIADAGNNRVAEIPVGGGPTISLGTGLLGPEGVAVDGTGNVFIADTGNSRVVEVPAVGGTQLAIGSGLKMPSALAVDAADDVFVADSGNNRVVEVPAGSGRQITIGSGLKGPGGIFVNSAGDVLIGDTYNNRVLEVPRSKAPALSFANATIATTGSGSPQTVGFENIGNQPLSVASVSYPVDFPIDFAANGSEDLCIGETSLSPGELCDLAVNFTPLKKGPLSEKLTITDNAGNVAGAKQSITLTGTAMEAQTLVFLPPASATYGAAPLNLSNYIEVTSGLPAKLTFVSGPATVKGTVVTFTGAGSVVIQASQAGNSYYLPAVSVKKTIVVGKALLTVTATNASVAFGKPLPKLTYTLAGFVHGDKASAVSGAPAETTSATAKSPVGTYKITISQGTLKAGNYTFAFEGGTLTITSAGTAAAPAFKAGAEATTGTRLIAITDKTPGAVIHYTVTGSTPTAASTKYTGAFTIKETETIKAIAIAPGYTASPVASERYTIQ